MYSFAGNAIVSHPLPHPIDPIKMTFVCIMFGTCCSFEWVCTIINKNYFGIPKRRGGLMEAIIFHQIQVARDRTLSLMEHISEQQADIVPAGFNNNLRWHIGHILTTHERLSFRLIEEQLELPEELMALFVNGTKPADWQTTPPDLSVLRKLLMEQPSRIQKRLEGRTEESLKVPFKDLNQLGEVLLFMASHEALHAGYMMALKRAVATEQA